MAAMAPVPVFEVEEGSADYLSLHAVHIATISFSQFRSFSLYDGRRDKICVGTPANAEPCSSW